MTINQIIKYAEKNNISLDDEILIASPSDEIIKNKKPETIISVFRQMGSYQDNQLGSCVFGHGKHVLLIANTFHTPDLSGFGKSISNIVEEATFDKDLKTNRLKPDCQIAKEFVAYLTDNLEHHLNAMGYDSFKFDQELQEKIPKVCSIHTNQEYSEWHPTFVADLAYCLTEMGVKKEEAIKLVKELGE